MPARLSACIVAMNEEDRIADCIRSADFCDEILVVDSHSTDRTREIAASLGARVIERDWPGNLEQKRFATAAASHDWILNLDADERVSEQLRAEILALREGGFAGAAAWEVPRLSEYLGRWIRHGTWYPDHVVRLFDRRRGQWSGYDPHGHFLPATRPKRLRGEIRHHPFRSLSDHLRKIDGYTTTMARELHARGSRATVMDLLTRPLGRFLKFYLIRRGFLDGWRGFLLACLAAHYAQMKYAKLFLEGRHRPQR